MSEVSGKTAASSSCRLGSEFPTTSVLVCLCVCVKTAKVFYLMKLFLALIPDVELIYSVFSFVALSFTVFFYGKIAICMTGLSMPEHDSEQCMLSH